MSLTLGPILMFAKDLQETEVFYRRLLGKAPKLKTPEALVFDIEKAELVFIKDPPVFRGNLDGLETERVRGKGIILHLSALNVDKEYKRLKRAGFTISSPPADKIYGRRQMYIYDCNGYNIAIETVIKS